MKVALIVPTYEYANAGYTYLAPSDFPTGLAYLAGALTRAGHEVIGVNVNNLSPEKAKSQALLDCLTAMLAARRPELIGIGGLCADYAFIKDAMTILRAQAPEIPVVLGGGIVTHDAEFILDALKPDYCVIGEGEEVLIQLVDHLTTGAPAIEEIPNIGYWRNGQARFTNKDMVYPALNQRAWPDYEPFDIDTMLACSTHGARNHFRYSREHPRIMPFIAARNCPFKCTFCIHQSGAKYTSRPMEDIFAELEDLYAKYQFNILIILDELFAINRQRLQEFCEGIIARKETIGWDFDWMFQTHASAALSVEDMKLARQAGCYYFSYGIESASPRVLESMRKKTRPEQISEAIAFAREAKIGFGGNFIFGDLAETPETIIETMTFMTRHCMDMLCYVTNISPYPGSLLFDHCLQQGLISDKLSYYEAIDRVTFNMTTMPDEAWVHFLHTLIWPMAGAYPWLIAVEPDEVTTEVPDPAFPTLIRRAVARCPHCDTAHPHRQPMSDALFAQGTIFPTGCPACGLRFRIRIGAHGQCSGAVLGREIDADTLTRLTKEALVPLNGIKRHINVLLLPAEAPPADDPLAPALDYLSGLALEEGFAASGLNVMTVPACAGRSPDDRSTWLAHLRHVCSGIRFDQIWVQIIDAELDDPLLAFLSSLAPVRVGLIPRSMYFGELVFRVPPALKPIQRQVDRRLRSMTHLLAADPRDARWLAANRKVQARWWLPALPASTFTAPDQAAPRPPLFFGQLPAGETETLHEGSEAYRLTGDAAQIPLILAQTGEQVAGILSAEDNYPANLPTLHADTLRQLQSLAFGLLRADLAASPRSLIGEIQPFALATLKLLAMAAGRPAQGLAPIADADLAAWLDGLPDATTADPTAFLAAYRVDEQLRDWLDWIAMSGGRPVAEMAAPTPGPLRQAADFVVAAQTAFQRQDFDAALLILEAARRADPLNIDIAMLYGEVRDLREEQVRTRIEVIWQREMAL